MNKMKEKLPEMKLRTGWRDTSVICLLQLRSWVSAQYGLAAWDRFPGRQERLGVCFLVDCLIPAFGFRGKTLTER